jgi:hypothetical protein
MRLRRRRFAGSHLRQDPPHRLGGL